MKLQTMLLPTGEFIIVGSGVTPLPPVEINRKLEELTGATAVLFTEHEVEVVDAIIDSAAKRVIPREIQEAFDAGATVSPAGLLDTRHLREQDNDCPCWPAGTDADARCGGCPKAQPEPYEPQVGDEVRISGESVYGMADGNGRHGRVVETDHQVPEHGDGWVYVDFARPGTANVTRYYRPEQLTKIDNPDSGTVE